MVQFSVKPRYIGQKDPRLQENVRNLNSNSKKIIGRINAKLSWVTQKGLEFFYTVPSTFNFWVYEALSKKNQNDLSYLFDKIEGQDVNLNSNSELPNSRYLIIDIALIQALFIIISTASTKTKKTWRTSKQGSFCSPRKTGSTDKICVWDVPRYEVRDASLISKNASFA